MKPFRNILIGVDLSAGDRLATSEIGEPIKIAIRRAIWLASQTGAKITFLATLDLDAHTMELLQQELGDPSHNVEVTAHEVLDGLVKQAEAEGVKADSALAFGKSWKEIIRHAIDHNCDLVVVGAREHNAASRILFGTTAIKLVHNCPCPVLVVRPDPDWSDLNILVATDFSPVSQTALSLAVGGAELTGADIHLIHSIEDKSEWHFWKSNTDEAKLLQAREKERAAAETELRDQLAAIDKGSLTKEVHIHMATGPASEAIVKAIEDLNIDLLVMGTIARGGLTGLFIGNTAEILLPQISCSLLAIKPDDFHCPISFD